MSIEAVPSLSRCLPRIHRRLVLRIAAVLAVSLLYTWTEALAGSEYTIKMIDMPWLAGRSAHRNSMERHADWFHHSTSHRRRAQDSGDLYLRH